VSAEVRVRVKLTFPEALVRRPVLAHLVREFDIDPDIRRADISDSVGWIVCELDGQADRIDAAVVWLRNEGIGVDLLGDVLES
jgi:ABC-type methionine transport system ATPase subunit